MATSARSRNASADISSREVPTIAQVVDEPGLEQVQQAGDQLALGEVPGGAEEDEGGGRGHGAQPVASRSRTPALCRGSTQRYRRVTDPQGAGNGCVHGVEVRRSQRRRAGRRDPQAVPARRDGQDHRPRRRHLARGREEAEDPRGSRGALALQRLGRPVGRADRRAVLRAGHRRRGGRRHRCAEQDDGRAPASARSSSRRSAPRSPRAPRRCSSSPRRATSTGSASGCTCTAR